MTDTSTFPRMRPPATVTEETRRFLQETKFYREGRPLYAHQVLSNHPRAAKSLNRFLDWGEDAVLSQRERRMLILRTSKRTRCAYEWEVHSQQGQKAGDVSPQRPPRWTRILSPLCRGPSESGHCSSSPTRCVGPIPSPTRSGFELRRCCQPRTSSRRSSWSATTGCVPGSSTPSECRARAILAGTQARVPVVDDHPDSGRKGVSDDHRR